jgi:hypothetical protein
VTKRAGFETESGISIKIALPEEAAKLLRKTQTTDIRTGSPKARPLERRFLLRG